VIPISDFRFPIADCKTRRSENRQSKSTIGIDN
jgi:hypothetical protein